MLAANDYQNITKQNRNISYRFHNYNKEVSKAV